MLNYIKFKLQGRSPKWRSVRAYHLKTSPYCEACESTEKLEVHHIIPFDVDPDRELNPSNLITLCKYCHLVLGHLKDYKIYNQFVGLSAFDLNRKRQLAYKAKEKRDEADRN